MSGASNGLFNFFAMLQTFQGIALLHFLSIYRFLFINFVENNQRNYKYEYI